MSIRNDLLTRAEEAARLYEHPFSLAAVITAARLAAAHNHQWGGLDAWHQEGNFIEDGEGMYKQVLTCEDIWQWVQTHTTPGPCGWGIAYPQVQGPLHLASICHETSTGRTRWQVSDNPYRPGIVQVHITILRPDDAGRIEFNMLMGWERGALAQTSEVSCEAYGDIEERHWDALWRCIGPRGLSLDGDTLLRSSPSETGTFAALPENVRAALARAREKEEERNV